MKTYSRDERHIEVPVGEAFEIALEAVPTTGYQWQVEVQGEAVRLADRAFGEIPHGFGASTTEQFRFEPLETGQASVRFTLARPWEDAPAETLVFDVHVEGE